VGVHGSIYKGSYNASNIPYFNSLPPLLSSPLDSWNSFNRYHFCIYVHGYTLFVPYSSSYPFPCHLSTPTGASSPWPTLGRTCSVLLFSDFIKDKNIKDKKGNMTFLLV
jgi:hypothetical protein